MCYNFASSNINIANHNNKHTPAMTTTTDPIILKFTRDWFATLMKLSGRGRLRVFDALIKYTTTGEKPSDPLIAFLAEPIITEYEKTNARRIPADNGNSSIKSA